LIGSWIRARGGTVVHKFSDHGIPSFGFNPAALRL
jgi:hypothetical protein